MAIKFASTQIKSAELHAVITRADGTVEDLGVIAYYHESWLKRTQFAAIQLFRNLFS